MKNEDTNSKNQEPEWEDQELPLFDDEPKSKQADVSAAMPAQPQQSFKNTLQNTTMLIPPETILSSGYLKNYNGINWPHYENMLKLYGIKRFVDREENGKPTLQQEKDMEVLNQAIEVTGNTQYKKKHITAEEVVKRDTKVYMTYGMDIIHALVFCDRMKLRELHAQILNSRNPHDSAQRETMYTKAASIYEKLAERYNYRDR